MKKLPYNSICNCRNCNSDKLNNILSLGEQSLTGVFRKSSSDKITAGPVDLVWCSDCGLLQMRQSYSLAEMYGKDYGYRSSLNSSMVAHLVSKVRILEKLVTLFDDDLVIDIGSNDATSLRAYTGNHLKVGIDPTGLNFIKYYEKDIALIPDFFSKEVFFENFPNLKAKVITSIAMFYDLEDPNLFVKDIRSVLHDDGIWHFEQSYLPAMLKTNSYDTICHEHLEFYSLRVIKDVLEKHSLRIIDVEINDINGGSFAVTACKKEARFTTNHLVIDNLIRDEIELGLDTLKPYLEFAKNMVLHRDKLRSLVFGLVAEGKKICGYGASTKGNVLLQYCGFTAEHISCIAEVNEDKFGSFTPGTNIPIISEDEAISMKPDYFLVLPCHFKKNILSRETSFINSGGKFIFPLPEIEII